MRFLTSVAKQLTVMSNFLLLEGLRTCFLALDFPFTVCYNGDSSSEEEKE
jgi:hypothetical protein